MGFLKVQLILENTAGSVTLSADKDSEFPLSVRSKRLDDRTTFGFDLTQEQAVEMSAFLLRACGDE